MNKRNFVTVTARHKKMSSFLSLLIAVAALGLAAVSANADTYVKEDFSGTFIKTYNSSDGTYSSVFNLNLMDLRVGDPLLFSAPQSMSITLTESFGPVSALIHAPAYNFYERSGTATGSFTDTLSDGSTFRGDAYFNIHEMFIPSADNPGYNVAGVGALYGAGAGADGGETDYNGDYLILGGTGPFDGAIGYGFSFYFLYGNPLLPADSSGGIAGSLATEFIFWTPDASPVPEPATMLLLGLGLMGLAGLRRKFQK